MIWSLQAKTGSAENVVQAVGVQHPVGPRFQLMLPGALQAFVHAGRNLAEASLDKTQNQGTLTVQPALLNALLHALPDAHQTLTLLPFLEAVGNHLVRLLQVVHLGKGEPPPPRRTGDAPAGTRQPPG